MDQDDIDYVRDRPWMIETFERQGHTDAMKVVRESRPGHDAEYPGDVTLVKTDQMRVGTQTPQQPKPRPAGAAGENVLPPEDEVDYSSWSVDELKAEIDARNEEEGRTEKIATSGKKSDLVDRLEADDLAELSA
jgi:hypothetical protein